MLGLPQRFQQKAKLCAQVGHIWISTCCATAIAFAVAYIEWPFTPQVIQQGTVLNRITRSSIDK